jgi:hypothetical protein
MKLGTVFTCNLLGLSFANGAEAEVLLPALDNPLREFACQVRMKPPLLH